MGLTLFAELGFGAVELMLGLDAPVSTLVVRDLLLKSIFAFFLGWPIYLGAAAAAAPGAGRGAAGRAAPRRAADACWEPRSRRCTCATTTAPAMTTASRCGSPSSAASPSRSSRSSSSGSGSCRSSPAPIPGRGEQQPHPRVQGHRPARRHPRPQRQGPGRQPHQPGAAGRTREAARRPGRRRARAGAARPTLTHMSLPQVRERSTKSEEVAAGAPVTLRRTSATTSSTTWKRTSDRFPGVTVQRVFVRHYPDGTLAAHVLGSVGEIYRRRAEGTALQGPRTGRRGRPGRGRVHLRQVPARQAGPDQDPGRRARPADARRPAASRSRRSPATT